MRGHVDHLHILGDDKFFQAGFDCIHQSRLKVEEDFLRQPVREQVTFHLTLRVHERGVATGVFGKIVDIVGHLAVQEFYSILAQQTQPRATGEIQ